MPPPPELVNQVIKITEKPEISRLKFAGNQVILPVGSSQNRIENHLLNLEVFPFLQNSPLHIISVSICYWDSSRVVS
jgi:hypothetical protein